MFPWPRVFVEMRVIAHEGVEYDESTPPAKQGEIGLIGESI